MPAIAMISHIKNQFQQFYNGGNWVTTGARQKLLELDPSIIDQKQPGHRHTIAELVLHITAWRKFVLARLKGDDDFDIEDNTESDWPAFTSWDKVLEQFTEIQQDLEEALTSLDEKRLEEIVAGRTYRYAHMLQGMIHHDYYHYGQIGTLAASFTKT
jgi:uncharacterized damage-inducible protein DinB